MKNSRKLVILLVFLLPVFGRCLPNFPLKQCSNNFSMPGHHQLKENIKQVLSNIIQRIQLSPENYASHTAGSGSNAIYGHAQCRGDINHENCLGCVLEETRRIKKDCHSSSQVELWNDLCFLRYDSTNFLTQVVKGSIFGFSSKIPVFDRNEFIKASKLVKAVATMKAIIAPNRFGAMASPKLTNGAVIYGMVQCTGDLQLLECNSCINSFEDDFQSICEGGANPDCALFAASCMFRYQTSNFLARPIA